MKKILIPVDGSEYSEKAMKSGKELAEAFGSVVVLVHVKDVRFPLYPYEPGNVVDMGSTLQQLVDAAGTHSQNILDKSKAFFADMADKVETIELEGDPANRLIKFVNENDDIDLIVMGSVGISGGIQSFILGSVTNKVLHHIKKPVLVVR
jgi:nucleotide-binding universal stress UspA family protein